RPVHMLAMWTDVDQPVGHAPRAQKRADLARRKPGSGQRLPGGCRLQPQRWQSWVTEPRDVVRGTWRLRRTLRTVAMKPVVKEAMNTTVRNVHGSANSV